MSLGTVDQTPALLPRTGPRRGTKPSRRATWSAVLLLTSAGLVAALNAWSPALLARRVSVGGRTSEYEYRRIGSPSDVVTPTRAGFVLEGGGTDIDDSFRWLIERSGGGDLLVIRTSGDDAYNPYIYDVGHAAGVRPNSVATLVVRDRKASSDPFVVETVSRAEALWIAGGAQAKHLTVWRDTPVAAALRRLMARGVPIGGTSSGLAVLGDSVYTAEVDGPTVPHLISTEVTRDPTNPRITLRPGLLRLPFLGGDTMLEPHFVQESRYGRLAAFLARASADGGPTRAIGIDKRTALLVEPDGRCRVITHPESPFGTVTLFRMSDAPTVFEAGLPLSARLDALQFSGGSDIDLAGWGVGNAGKPYVLEVDAGEPRMVKTGG